MKKQNLFLTMILAITISLILFFVLFFNKTWIKGKGVNQSVKNVNNQNIEYDLAGKRLVYSNFVYKYKISFPDDWSFYRMDKPDYVAFFDPMAWANQSENDLKEGMKIEIVVLPIESDVSLVQKVNEDIKIEELDSGVKMISKDNITVSSQPAIRVNSELPGLLHGIATYIKFDENLLIINGGIASISEVKKYTDLYNGILSTFTFLK